MLVREARGQWWFTDSGSGLQAKWTYTAESRNVLAMLILLPGHQDPLESLHEGGMKVTKERAEKEVTRGGAMTRMGLRSGRRSTASRR